MRPEWTDFVGGKWESEINVRDFIQKNYTPYDGDESFLAGPTQNTTDLWAQVLDLSKQEREAGGVLDMDTKVVSTIVSHGPGYLDKSKETIVGFQTDKPFKRSMQPYGGIRMAEKACADNGYTVDPEISEFFSTHRKTHNAGSTEYPLSAQAFSAILIPPYGCIERLKGLSVWKPTIFSLSLLR